MSAETATTGVPVVSEHALDRWDERTDPTSVAPETAWTHAQRVNAGGPLRNVDVRLHRPSQTLLLLDAGCITTVYALDELREDVYHAVKHALEDTHE